MEKIAQYVDVEYVVSNWEYVCVCVYFLQYLDANRHLTAI